MPAPPALKSASPAAQRALQLLQAVLAAALLALGLCGGAAQAATGCTLASTPIVFGGYDVFSPASLDSSATLVLTCSRFGGPQNTVVAIGIGPGAHGGGSGRRLQAGTGQFLAYNLFRDAGRSAVWGDVAGLDTFTQALAVPNQSSAQLSVTVFGRIPAGQDVPKGVYADRVVVTVTP